MHDPTCLLLSSFFFFSLAREARVHNIEMTRRVLCVCAGLYSDDCLLPVMKTKDRTDVGNG